MTRTLTTDTSACACTNLRAAARGITQRYDEALRPSGIRATQFTLLERLERAGPEKVTRLAEALVMDQSTLTRNLQVLEKERLVELVAGDDRRTRIVTITERGRAVLKRARPLWRQAQTQVVGGIGEERYRDLLESISVLRAAVRG